jgi:dephospho-CoA kinase
MRIALTGGIACGKSLLAKYLNELGVETLDADDIVHTIISEEERRRIADEIFRNPEKRKELEARVHPLVRERLEQFARSSDEIKVEIIPLLFECHWESNYDIIICVSSPRSLQVERMISKRGYSEEQAEARLCAQIPVEEKAVRSHYVVENGGSAANLKQEAKRLVDWLKGR